MKKTLVLLGVLAAVTVPLSAHADPESQRTGDSLARSKGKTHNTAAVARTSRYQTVYITNKSVTGSNIPLVVGRYNGRYDSMAPTAVYGRPDLDRNGQLSVGGELTQRDPAVSSVGGRR